MKTKIVKCAHCPTRYSVPFNTTVSNYCSSCKAKVKETYRASLLKRPEGEPKKLAKVSKERWASVFEDLVSL